MQITSTAPHDDSDVVVRLTADQAIVLFELLSRWTTDNQSSTPSSDCFKSTAEGTVLHDMLVNIEKQMAAPFGRDYTKILEETRERLAQ